jgi:hypothetical protein
MYSGGIIQERHPQMTYRLGKKCKKIVLFLLLKIKKKVTKRAGKEIS